MATLETVPVTGITLTERAAEEISNLLKRQEQSDSVLRVFVSGGGCSGLNYQMAIDNEIEEDDFIFENFGVKVVVDPHSLPYLKGSSIDWVEDVMGGGFKIDNPNAVRSCGCGSSFSTEEGAESAGGCGTGGCGSGCGCH